MRQGAVGQVRLVERDGRTLVEKRMDDPRRHDTEVAALRALAGGALPVPAVVEVQPGRILMTHLTGIRVDELDADRRLAALRASAAQLRTLHGMAPPPGLAPPPDDAAIVARYGAAGGPPLRLVVPPPGGTTFCHGDWTAGNLLAEGGRISGIVDWEASHAGDPIRDLSRIVWAATRDDPRSHDALLDGYGADAATAALVDAWAPIHAAELWLWFREAGPPAYLAQLTAELSAWPSGAER